MYNLPDICVVGNASVLSNNRYKMQKEKSERDPRLKDGRILGQCLTLLKAVTTSATSTCSNDSSNNNTSSHTKKSCLKMYKRFKARTRYLRGTQRTRHTQRTWPV